MVYFRVDYTPRVSGLYSASIKINDMYLWTDHSFGVMIDLPMPVPITAHITRTLSPSQELNNYSMWCCETDSTIGFHSIGTPGECNHLDKFDEPTVAVKETEIGKHRWLL